MEMNLEMDAPMKVALAEDHVMVRAGVRLLLESMGNVEVVIEAADGRTLLERLSVVPADVVLIDLTMPGMDGIAAIRQIRADFPHIRVLVLSMHVSAGQVRQAMEAGACGYITKDAPDFELRYALRTAVAAGAYISPGISKKLLERPQPEPEHQLTERQVQILALLAQGKPAKEIGVELGLSPRTIESHRSRIMERLQIRNMANLTRYAVRSGLLKP